MLELIGLIIYLFFTFLIIEKTLTKIMSKGYGVTFFVCVLMFACTALGIQALFL